MLGYRKTINSQKNSSREKDFCEEWFAHAIAHTARADDNNNNTHLISLLLVKKFKSFLLNLRYEIHGKRFIAYALALGDVLGGWSQRLDVYFIDVISVLNGDMEHSRAIKSDQANILAML